MFIRGAAFKKWTERALREERYTQVVENGCHVEVRAREAESGDVEILIAVYAADGHPVVERIQTVPGQEWAVQDALKKGIDQAERVAGGESGRLPCADAGTHANE